MQSSSQSRKTFSLTIIVLAVLCVSVSAYLLSLPPPKGPKVTITSSPFELSMSLGKSAYSLTDNMTISFYLRNISNESVKVEISDLIGEYPNPIVYKTTAVYEGVDTISPGAPPSRVPPGVNIFSTLVPFDYTLVSGNGTVFDQFPYGPYNNESYLIYFMPYASLNQTIYINLIEYTSNHLSLIGRSLQKGAYQISGAIKGITEIFNSSWTNIGSSTLQTPPIKFTLR